MQMMNMSFLFVGILSMFCVHAGAKKGKFVMYNNFKITLLHTVKIM